MPTGRTHWTRTWSYGLLLQGALAMLVLLQGCGRIKLELPEPTPVSGSGQFQVGMARRTITPIPGYPMGGHSIAGRNGRGAWGDLHARAIWMEDPDGRPVVLVATDLWAVSFGLRDAVLARLVSEHGITQLGRHELIISASHTHHSPAGFDASMGLNLAGGRRPVFDRRLFDDLTNQIALAVALAYEQREPAQLEFASLPIEGVARNRSLEPFTRDPEAPEILAENPLGPDHCVLPAKHPAGRLSCEAVDPSLRALEFRRPDGSLIGVAAFTAVHVTAMPNTTTFYQADIFGLAATRMEWALGQQEEQRSATRGASSSVGAAAARASAASAKADDEAAKGRGESPSSGDTAPASADAEGATTGEPSEGEATTGTGGEPDTSSTEPGDLSQADPPTAAAQKIATPADGSTSKSKADEPRVRPPVVVALFNGPEGDVSPAWDVQDRAAAERVAGRLELGLSRVIDAPSKRLDEVTRRIDAGIFALDKQRFVDSEGRERTTANVAIIGRTALQGAEDGVTKLIRTHSEGDRKRRPRGAHGYKKSSGIVISKGLIAPEVSLELIRFGEGPDALVFATLPGEFTTAMGRRIRHAIAEGSGSDPARVIMLGLSNGYRGYFVTPHEYDLSHYESGQTYWGPHAGELVLARYRCLASGSDAMTCGARKPESHVEHRPGPQIRGSVRPGRYSARSLARVRCAALTHALSRPIDAPLIEAEGGRAGMAPFDWRADQEHCRGESAVLPSFEFEMARPAWPRAAAAESKRQGASSDSAEGQDAAPSNGQPEDPEVMPHVIVEVEVGDCRFEPLTDSNGPVASDGHQLLRMLARSGAKRQRWWVGWLAPQEGVMDSRVRFHVRTPEGEVCSEARLASATSREPWSIAPCDCSGAR